MAHLVNKIQKFAPWVLVIFVVFVFFTEATFASTELSAAQLPAPQNALALPGAEPESKTVIRDAGMGLGVGTIAGVGFVLMGAGRFPSNNSQFDLNTMGSAMLVGLAGGLVTGFWEIKHNRRLSTTKHPLR